MTLVAYRPKDQRGVEILDRLEKQEGIQPKLVDDDGTRWYDTDDVQKEDS